jgi:L-fuculose-phosphate aldolase
MGPCPCPAQPKERYVDPLYVDGLIDATQRLLASGAIGANGHGNVSLRVADADEMYFTSASSLRGLTQQGIARVRLDGTLIEGQLPPIQGAVVDMHTSRYRASDDVLCVLHTHSPFATAFAVAQRLIECWIEAMAMFGLAGGVPVAAYGPRGSVEAVANIDAAVSPGVPAVLLANHGVLVFHRSPELAVLVSGIVEEAAHAERRRSVGARGSGRQPRIELGWSA